MKGRAGEGLILVGKADEIVDRLIQESQKVTTEVIKAENFTEPLKQRFFSTLNYWTNQLQGNVDASLATKKKNLHAIKEMVTLLRQVKVGLDAKGEVRLDMPGELRQ